MTGQPLFEELVLHSGSEFERLQIFKNTRGVLVNWELRQLDEKLLQGQQPQVGFHFGCHLGVRFAIICYLFLCCF
jgi:hypothetical protein